MSQNKFTGGEHMELISVTKNRDTCFVLSRLPYYIYTKKSDWIIFKDELWQLVDFWPSLREVSVNENPPRILRFRFKKNVEVSI